MFQIRNATFDDKPFWFSLDRHISKSEFELKVRDGRCYIIAADTKPIGVMRYNLFWDNIPFLTMIHFEDLYRGKGFGTKAMQYWENEMREAGHKIVMTSTQADEGAQHFYRKLGYKENGCLIMDIPQFEQPLEMFFIKQL